MNSSTASIWQRLESVDPVNSASDSSTRRFSNSVVVIWFIATAILAQIVFWAYSMPGPQLREAGNLNSAVGSCLVAAMVFLIFPLLISLFVMGQIPKQLGLGIGDWQFGWKASAFFAPVLLIGTWIGSADPQIKAFYPIPGEAVYQSFSETIIWIAAYLLFYVSFEFFYRGFLLRSLIDPETRIAILFIIGMQAFFCFLIHIGKPPVELMASLPASVLFGWIAWRSCSIWYGVALHFAIGVVNDLGAIQLQ